MKAKVDVIEPSEQMDRLPPHAPEAEQGVIGCCLLSPENCIAEVQAKLGSNEAFYDLRHQTIWHTLTYLRSKNVPVDIILVQQELAERHVLEQVGGIPYLYQLQDGVPSAANLSYYLDIVWEKFQLRTLVRACTDISSRAHDFTGPPDDLILGAQSDLDTLRSTTRNGHLSFRTPDEILALHFDDSDILLGDRILAKGQPLVIAGQGGLGKSRLSLQMIACLVSGRKFLTFDTRKSSLRWLVVQSENNNRRLQSDISKLKSWLGNDWKAFNDLVTIHTLETDSDGFLALDQLSAVNHLKEAIAKYAPDCILYDPLRDFGMGDMNKDADMTLTLQSLSTISRQGNPERTPVILHHALTGKGGAAKATGHDRASFARNSKVLFGWTRAQINIAAVDPDNNSRLIIACGKNNNGREFPPFAVKLDPDSMIYECDESVDLVAWKNEMDNSKPKKVIDNDLILELVPNSRTRKKLVNSIMENTGCSRSAAYYAIERMEKSKKLTFSKVSQQFCLPNE